MFLIEKGKKPQPICRGCHEPGPEGYYVRPGYIYVCLECIGKMAQGKMVVRLFPCDRRAV